MNLDQTVYIVVDKRRQVRSVWADGDRAAAEAIAKNEEVRPEPLDDRPFKVEPWAVRK